VDPSVAPKAVAASKGSDQIHLGYFLDRDLGERRTWVWLTASNTEAFDMGQQDATKLIAAVKKSMSMKRQVLIGYDVACRSRNLDSAPVFERAGIIIERNPGIDGDNDVAMAEATPTIRENDSDASSDISDVPDIDAW
jgi:hypothetical protein